MKKIKFGISMIPFLLAGSIAANAGVSAYENRPREFEEITDCSNIDKVTYEKYEKISYQDFYKKLKKNNSEFLIEYKIVETSEENRTILDSDYILNEREYLAFHAFNRQNRNLLEAIENGEIEIKEIHYIHHVALEGDEVKNFNIEDAYLTENLNDVFYIDSYGNPSISGKVIFEKSKNDSITAICSYKLIRKNIFGGKSQTKIKKSSITIPASKNKDQCKYDDRSISSQENLMDPKGRLQHLGSTIMTYDEMKNISCNFYIIHSEEEVTKDELIQLLKDDNKTDTYIQMYYEYRNHPYETKRYSTTKQDYLDGKSDNLKDLLKNPDVIYLKIKIYSKKIVKELTSNNETNDTIDIIKNNCKLVCIPTENGNYHVNILVRDSIDSVNKIQYKKTYQNSKQKKE